MKDGLGRWDDLTQDWLGQTVALLEQQKRAREHIPTRAFLHFRDRRRICFFGRYLGILHKPNGLSDHINDDIGKHQRDDHFFQIHLSFVQYLFQVGHNTHEIFEAIAPNANHVDLDLAHVIHWVVDFGLVDRSNQQAQGMFLLGIIGEIFTLARRSKRITKGT
jgi:hypothetical protein